MVGSSTVGDAVGDTVLALDLEFEDSADSKDSWVSSPPGAATDVAWSSPLVAMLITDDHTGGGEKMW